MTIERPWALLLLAVPVVVWLLRRRRGPAEVVVASVRPFSGAGPAGLPRAVRRSGDAAVLCALASSAFLALAAAGIALETARPTVLVLEDVSESMRATLPDGRSVADAAVGRALEFASSLRGAGDGGAGDGGAGDGGAGDGGAGDNGPPDVVRIPWPRDVDPIVLAQSVGHQAAVVATDAPHPSLRPPFVVVGPPVAASPNAGIEGIVLDPGEIVVRLRVSDGWRGPLTVVHTPALPSPRREVVVRTFSNGRAVARFPVEVGRGAPVQERIELAPGGSLRDDDLVLIERRPGPRQVSVTGPPAAVLAVRAVLRAAEIATTDGSGGECRVRCGAGSGDDESIPFLLVLGPGPDERIRGIACAATADIAVRGDEIQGTSVHANEFSALPAPGLRLDAAMRLSGGHALWRDSRGALAAISADGRAVVAALSLDRGDPPAWAADPSFPAFVLGALDALTGGGERIECADLVPEAEIDVPQTALPAPSSDSAGALVHPSQRAVDGSSAFAWLAAAAAAAAVVLSLVRRA